MNRRNVIAMASGEAFWGLGMAAVLASTVLTVFLREHGAGEAMIGCIPAIESGAGVTLQFVGLFLFSSRHRRKRQVLAWHLYAIIPFFFATGILAAVSTHLSHAAVRWTALLFYAGFMAGLGSVGAAFMDWVAQVFDERERGTALGIGSFVSSVTGFGGGLLAGALLELRPAPNAYTWLYLLAGTSAAIGILLYGCMRDPPMDNLKELPRPQLRDVAGYVHASLSNRSFRLFLVSRILATAGFSMIPLIAVYYTSPEGGNLAGGRVVSYGAVMTLTGGLSCLVFGRLGDREGHAIGLLLGIVAQVGTLALLLWTRGTWSCLLVYSGTGVCLGAGMVSYYNALMETCPHDNRFAHITVGNFVVGLVGIAAPLLGGVVAAAFGTGVLFESCLAISTIALVWHVLLVREPRRELTFAEMLMKK